MQISSIAWRGHSSDSHAKQALAAGILTQQGLGCEVLICVTELSWHMRPVNADGKYHMIIIN